MALHKYLLGFGGTRKGTSGIKPRELCDKSIDCEVQVKIGNQSMIRIDHELVMSVLGEGGVLEFCQADQKALLQVPPVIKDGLERGPASVMQPFVRDLF